MQTTDGAIVGTSAFERGVRVAQTAAGRAGVLSTIFSTRTLGLTGALDGASQREYLSGLLIGHEISALQDLLQQRQQQTSLVILVGEPALCERYASALRAYGVARIQIMAQATERGLWQLALGAGLLKTV
ncbi:2-dehydro-3-deoxygalactonokinase [Collimonas sp.]|jgi:2-dehydro-3-deoxygalactonokinase|uniref:2-dehydro-3-deoxygalactonokinase n=1 Tax=Collimonas sp. TaxID=1963772 RepID=UPI0037BED30E